MPRINHHDKPFDQATLTKLLLFEEYLTSWLPVFIHLNGIQQINIFDFFCGPGTDIANNPGSPLRAIKVVNQFANSLPSQRAINLFFCDQELDKINTLDKKLTDLKNPYASFNIKTHPCGFETSFPMLYPEMRAEGAANFLFIDPTGWALTPDIFQQIIALDRTDFLLFTPSQFAGRFGEEGFKKYLPGFDKSKIKDNLSIHKHLCEYYKYNFVPNDKTYYLAPFSIKKNTNVYGLIFGSNNITGLYKFLESCWKINPENGESNFEFRGDLPSTGQGFLIESLGRPKRVRDFEEHVKNIVLSKKVTTNKALLDESILKGFLGSHAKKILSDLKKKNKIRRVPSMSFRSIYRDKKIDKIEVI